VEKGLMGKPLAGGLTVEPLFRRPPMLIAHRMDDPPPFTTLPSGDLVVTWPFLVRDVVGTLGWRPDLLTRLEGPPGRDRLSATPRPRSAGRCS
jgi:hypothetical protein